MSSNVNSSFTDKYYIFLYLPRPGKGIQTDIAKYGGACFKIQLWPIMQSKAEYPFFPDISKQPF